MQLEQAEVSLCRPLSEAQRELESVTRSFLENTAPARPSARDEHPVPFDSDWWARVVDLGWTSLVLPAELGGPAEPGTELRTAAVVAEQFGRTLAPGPLIPASIAMLALGDASTSDQATGGAGKASDLVLWCHPATHSSAQRTTSGVTAEPVSGGFLLNGAVPDVEDVASASHVIVAASENSSARSIQLLVDTTADGVSTRQYPTVDVFRRFGEVVLHNAFVERSAVLASDSDADSRVRHQLNVALALNAADTVGIVDHVLNATLEYTSERWAFGRPVASYQAIKHRCADMKMWVESAAAMSAATTTVQVQSEAASKRILAASVYTAERSLQLIQDCIQMHGGIGVTWEHEIHLYLRRAMVNWARFGTPRVHRQHLAALLDERSRLEEVV